MIDHRIMLEKFQGAKGEKRQKIWNKWKKDISKFHLTVVIAHSGEDYYQLEAWKILKKSKPEKALLRVVVANTTVEGIRLKAAKLLNKKSSR